LTWQRSHEAVENRSEITSILQTEAAEERPLGILL
jgi:hypothetical protein